MEPLSVSLALLSVLPLPIELFKQSVQAYKLFIEARESEKAMSYFATRLLIEHDRLIQWGKASGLYAAPNSDPEKNQVPDASSLFCNPDHLALVRRILGHIKDLFDDSVSLAKKYGINIVGKRPIAPAEQRLLGGTENQSSLDKSTGSFTDTAKIGFMKLKWVIKDKEGFEKLLKDLAQLNDNLYSLHSSDIIRAIIRDTVASVIRQADHPALGNMRRLNGQDFDGTNALVSTVPATDGAVEPFPYESIPTTASAAYMVQQTKIHKGSRSNRRVHRVSPKRVPRGQQSRQFTSVHDITPGIDFDPDVRQQAAQSGELRQDLTFSVGYQALDANQDENSSLERDWTISSHHESGISPLINLEQQSAYVGSGSRIRIWNRATDLEPIRVFLEEKVLLTGSVSRPELYDKFLEEMDSEIHNLEDVARLLNEASTASAFRALRCIGMTKRHHNRISMIYELPGNVDQPREPLDLAKVLESDTYLSTLGSMRDGLTVSLPSLTKRLQLAKTLISAMYQLHSASWMHREFSAENVLLFWSESQISPSERLLPYDLSVPYIDGFKNSRSSVYGLSPSWTGRKQKLPSFLAEKVYRHPAYLLSKNQSRSSPHRSCHRFRHDYYALGLVLLEIGLWSPLRKLQVDVLRDSSVPYHNGTFYPAWHDEPLGGEDKSRRTVEISEEWLEQTTQEISNRTIRIENHDTWESLDVEGWPAGLEDAIIPDLRRAIQDEQIEDMTATPEDPRDRKHYLHSLCHNWGKIYPVEMVRQSAIRMAESHLAGCMGGDKYQDIVLQCLRSDFGLSGDAPEGEWLHEFNWRVVRSIEQCCV